MIKQLFQAVEEELADIVAPLQTIKTKLELFVNRKDAAIFDRKKDIEEANQIIEMHEIEKEQASKVLGNVSALLK